MRLRWLSWMTVACCAACGGATGSSTALFVDDGGADGGADGAAAPSDAAAAVDGAVVASGGSTDDGGPGGNAQSLSCGSAACAIPGESCCVYDTSPPTYACVAGSGCPVVDGGGGGGRGTALQCSGAANCPANTVCCVYENANKQVASDCRAACASNQAQLCDPTVSAAASGCPASAPCSSNNVTDWGIPNSYATCGGVGN